MWWVSFFFFFRSGRVASDARLATMNSGGTRGCLYALAPTG